MTVNESITYEISDNIMFLGKPDGIREIVVELCNELHINIFEVEDIADIIAVPSFLCILDPSLISLSDWEGLASWVVETNDSAMKILLTSSSLNPTLPSRNVIKIPSSISRDFLKFLLLKTRSRMKLRTHVWEKAERRIIRLMYMLRLLDNGRDFTVAEIAKEFQISKRTIQRDLIVLEMAGYPILRSEEWSYSLSPDFRVYEMYYDGFEN